MGGYLELLEALLRDGLQYFSPTFQQAQLTFVLSLQQPDGGFPGRRGGSDLYYTDFALRLLGLLDAPAEAVCASQGYLSTRIPRTLLEVFSLLNCRRLLGTCPVPIKVDRTALRRTVAQQTLPDGGYTHLGGSRLSAYQTFLGWLCCGLLSEAMPSREQALARVAALQRPDGGFVEQAGEEFTQTNATAAAVAFLAGEQALSEPQARRAGDYLLSTQLDGGWPAHPQAPQSDLLSTFTALLTLAALDQLAEADLRHTAVFLRQSADPCGGFRSNPADLESDIEYTYYGVAALALLSAALES